MGMVSKQRRTNDNFVMTTKIRGRKMPHETAAHPLFCGDNALEQMVGVIQSGSLLHGKRRRAAQGAIFS
jgi:hypothetical protein